MALFGYNGSYRLPADAELGLAQYHAARRNGVLLVPRCRSCGERHWYPRPFCPHCLSADLDWEPATGRGRIYSYSVVRRANPPYVITFVTLDEGVTMMSNIVDAEIDDIRIGSAVRLVFRDDAGGEPRAMFTLE